MQFRVKGFNGMKNLTLYIWSRRARGSSQENCAGENIPVGVDEAGSSIVCSVSSPRMAESRRSSDDAGTYTDTVEQQERATQDIQCWTLFPPVPKPHIMSTLLV